MKVEIYGAEECPNCETAETLSQKAGLEYKMLKVEKDFKIQDLFKKVGTRVAEFPQIFVDDKYIGNVKKYREFLKETVKEDEDDDLSGLEL